MEFFTFELKSWLKKPMVYVFFLINFLLVLVALVSDDITVGEKLGNIHKNSPYVVMYYASFMSLLAIVMSTAFLNQAALKDYENNFHSILFASPFSKRSYLLGRFLSSFLVSILPLLGVFFAILIAPLFLESDEAGPVYLGAYLNSLVLFIIPNAFLIGAIIFSLASLIRNTSASFVGAIGLLIAYLMSGSLITGLDHENLAILLDPLGINSLSAITKYWTVNDKNTTWLSLNGVFLINRLIWIGIAMAIFSISYFKISLTNIKSKKKETKKESVNPDLSYFKKLKPISIFNPTFGLKNTLLQLSTKLKSDYLGIVKSPAFLITTLFALINMLIAMTNADVRYGSGNFPVTYLILEAIDGSFHFFIIILIAYYSAVLIWRDKNVKINEIIDATPHAYWVPMATKFLSIFFMVGSLLLTAMILGMLVQTTKGYYNFEPLLYIKNLIVFNWLRFAIIIAIAFFIQVMVNNMFLGIFVFILFTLLNHYGWGALDIDSNLLKIGSIPGFIYSDMSKFGPYAIGITAYTIYWLLFSAILLFFTVLFWVRGKELNFKNRLNIAYHRLSKSMLFWGIGLVTLWVTTGGFLYYNTEILNTNISSSEEEMNSINYEIKYKQYEDIPQPRIVSIDYNIDIYPESRQVYSKAQVWVKNKHLTAIESIHFSHPSTFSTSINIPGSKIELIDEELDYSIHKLSTPLKPGETLLLEINSEYVPRGIENEVEQVRITHNGTFIDKSDLMPVIGYNVSRTIANNNVRKKHGLQPVKRMPKLTEDCGKHCQNSYISSDSDWIRLACTISTSSGQTAIAPGTLTKEWKEDGRSNFRYVLDKPVLNFYSFLSARYEVKREKWNDVDLEVYYHKGHEYNVNRMLLSMRKSLEYYSTNFSPYQYNEARIIEFPRFSSFAQAFPGTMPYAESMGFITDFDSGKKIDRSFFFVAHEMAHQWWAHQVISAPVQGGTMMVESFAQYSALMVMEETYGQEKMQEFLRYEMDAYLRSRGYESKEEMPLMKVENQQYIHYRKGSVVMYALAKYLGADKMNTAMKNYISKMAFQDAPYPTSLDFMEELEKVTPDSLQYLVDDLLKKITLYSNKMVGAEYAKMKDGSYQVTLSVEAEKYESDGKGIETSLPLNDYIFIGVYGDGDGQEEPKLQYYKQHKISKKNNTFTIIVDQKPSEAGIDPIHLLIDRVPDDNIKKVKVAD